MNFRIFHPIHIFRSFFSSFFFSANAKWIFLLWLIILASGFNLSLYGQDARFTVVLDAGHGGHDSGAKGSFSLEKNINLEITLKLGQIIEQKFTDKEVKVVYTRKTDKYLTLQERADVVNDNHADLFICIHTNSSPGASAYGAETYTLGLAKTKSNLDVAMRENSVITLEENYKTKYQGFDPKSVDSYIMFEFMQDKYIDRSVNFASIVQKQFLNYCKRLDRGVRQAGFWVLHRSACPSVLVEVGFISNHDEERFLNSESGQTQMATAIFNAFVDYKREHDRKSGRQVSNVTKYEPAVEKVAPVSVDTQQLKAKSVVSTTVVAKNVEKNSTDSAPVSVVADKAADKVADTKIAADKPVFSLQLFASVNKFSDGSPHFKGVKNVDSYRDGHVYKYIVGKTSSFAEIEKTRKELKSKFPEAFVVAFMGTKRITVKEAMELSK